MHVADGHCVVRRQSEYDEGLVLPMAASRYLRCSNPLSFLNNVRKGQRDDLPRTIFANDPDANNGSRTAEEY